MSDCERDARLRAILGVRLRERFCEVRLGENEDDEASVTLFPISFFNLLLNRINIETINFMFKLPRFLFNNVYI